MLLSKGFGEGKVKGGEEVVLRVIDTQIGSNVLALQERLY